MRYLLMVALCLTLLTIALPAHAVIVHHCDYGLNSTVVHGGHDGTAQDDFETCGNVSDNPTDNPFNGECEHNSSYYWSFMQCTTSGGRQTCQMSGTIDCPNGDKSYSFTCAGPVSNFGAIAGSGRDHAACTSQEDLDYCGCSSPGYYCANGGAN